ncbi:MULTISPECIES: hypothetical protein [Nonomuraea]|uniref:hypothetical protein n=1 Tax=Nonomuraea ceibae TaxID=1935170 RepID=UPI001C5EA853|nr:hypothetical protein [Nonomuraea ceibae]
MFLPIPLSPPLRDNPAMLRQRVHTFATIEGLCACRVADLVLAAHEAALLLIDTGCPDATLSLWADQAGVSLHLYDPTSAITDDRIAESRTPHTGMTDSTVSLTVVLFLCDIVTLDRSDGAARLHLRLRPADHPALADRPPMLPVCAHR